MIDHKQNVIEVLKNRFDLDLVEFREDISLMVPPEKLVDVCQMLKEPMKFDRLSALTAVDYGPEEHPRFHIIYKIFSHPFNTMLGLRVPLAGTSNSISTISHIYPNANWNEREVFDLFGIVFENHPDLRRIMMPADWVGHPLRKDYPVGEEEVQFSFNYSEIDRNKPYAKE